MGVMSSGGASLAVDADESSQPCLSQQCMLEHLQIPFRLILVMLVCCGSFQAIVGRLVKHLGVYVRLPESSSRVPLQVVTKGAMHAIFCRIVILVVSPLRP